MTCACARALHGMGCVGQGKVGVVGEMGVGVHWREDNRGVGCRTEPEAPEIGARALNRGDAGGLAGRLAAKPTSRTDRRALPAICPSISPALGT
jgi:hypothetical protein